MLAAHSQCGSASYCDIYGDCWQCTDCLAQRDSFDGRCPAKCGVNDPGLAVNMSIPSGNELDIVGNINNFLQPGCSASTVLNINNNTHISFEADTAVGYDCCALIYLVLCLTVRGV